MRSGGFSFAQADEIFKNFFGGRDPFADFFDDDDFGFPSMMGRGKQKKSGGNKMRDPFGGGFFDDGDDFFGGGSMFS